MTITQRVSVPPSIYTESGGLVKNAVLIVDKTRREVANAYAGHDRVEFTTWPEEIEDSVSPNWEQVDVLGRAEPYQIYANTGPRTISIEFMFFAQGSPTKGGSIPEAVDFEVMRNVRFLRSLAYPIIGQDGLIRRPATCWLHLGSLLTSRVILADAPGVTYAGPWEPDTLLPYQARVTCSFSEVNHTPKNAEIILEDSLASGMAMLSDVASFAANLWIA